MDLVDRMKKRHFHGARRRRCDDAFADSPSYRFVTIVPLGRNNYNRRDPPDASTQSVQPHLQGGNRIAMLRPKKG